jgi:putative acetyltransferase
MRSGPSPLTGLRLNLPCTEDPELFFAESPQDVEQAKVMCRGCQARLACLAGALERREPWGVWGGELLLRGAIVPSKRPRGRPRKDVVAIGLLPGAGAAAWSRTSRPGRGTRGPPARVGEIRLRPGPAAGHRDRVLIRRETERDADVIRAITTAAFAQGRPPSEVVPEARLIDELRASPAWLPALSLVAVTPAGEPIGHVLGTRGHVGPAPVIALGPLAVRPDRQQNGVGSALMHAVLGATDALGEPLVALLGDPAYYRRFGFELSTVYQITPPKPEWQPHFQVRVLTGYQPQIRGTFTYPEPFDRT